MPLDLQAGVPQELEVRRIRSPRYSLREDGGHTEELLLSIAQQGLIQPIVVRPVEDDNLFEVVAGNRRLNACKTLGVRKILCYVMELDDKESFELSITENLQRETLNPLEEAKAFKAYVDEFGYGSETELARRVGKSASYVSRRIALLRLPKEVQRQLLRRAKIGLTQELESLAEDDKVALAQLIAENKISNRRDLRNLVKRVKEGNDVEQHTGPSYYNVEEARLHLLNRTVSRFIASLEICMMRLDDIVNSLGDDEWVVRDILTQNRGSIHSQIDSLMKLKRKIQHELPPSEMEPVRHSYIHKSSKSLMR